MKGLYVHIPFCVHKCNYCDFNSYSGILDCSAPYVEAVLMQAEQYRGEEVDTVYIGGGTPTAIENRLLLSLIHGLKQCFSWKAVEVSVEANPATYQREDILRLMEAGVNRVSVGVQSFSDPLLRILGRIHSAQQAKEAIWLLQECGMEHISLDLMFSLPGQTVEAWEEDLRCAIALPVDHISCYGLKIEEGTPFARQGVRCAEEELDRKMYHRCIAILKKAGFDQYEISNFAKPGGKSQHNLKYWHCQEYIGLGAGAHSYYHGQRYSTVCDVKEFIRKKGRGCLENRVTITGQEAALEKIIMGMRLNEGVDETLLGQHPKLEQYIQSGFLYRNKGRICFTMRGFDVSNAILADLI